MIHLDTSVLVDALTGPRRSASALRRILERGERIGIATLVLYEWLRGPRRDVELAHQEALLPAAAAVPFGPREAALAAELYRVVPRARQRQFDLAVAACAVTWGAALWTLNADDFRDIPDLDLFGAQTEGPGGHRARAQGRRPASAEGEPTGRSCAVGLASLA